ncbi:hypothetical protein MJL79_29725, partial [Salmonella enterica subsp. enterica serovar Montevideo]|nr:hypothetical protein [Salmonella enterica subsp. enterica serovar Montevideo]
FGEIVRILLLNNTEITGGPNGISQIPKPTLFGLEFSRNTREGSYPAYRPGFVGRISAAPSGKSELSSCWRSYRRRDPALSAGLPA